MKKILPLLLLFISMYMEDAGDTYRIICYSSLSPAQIEKKVYVSKSQVKFLKGVPAPIWITFKDGRIATVLAENTKVKGENLKAEQQIMILQFKEALEK